MPGVDSQRLAMPIGEAIFTQRSIRRFRPTPIPTEDLRLIVEAAVRAPNGGNRQVARFLVVTDRARIREFGALYRGGAEPDAHRPCPRTVSVPTTLHPSVMDRFRAMFGVPKDVAFHFCIPLGYPDLTFSSGTSK